jgi:serine/threonine-protein kinase
MSQQDVQVYSGRYELRRHVARGGMAEVYLAHDRLLDRPVALKVLFPELSVDRSFVERFRREAQAAANLSHPNIVSVYDWGEEDNTYYIVMEYVDGRPLSNILRSEGTLLPDRAAGICADVAAALAFAHRNGVIHRDVKPGNVLITADGTVKVTDFGIARAANTEENLTQTGAVMGTATYFSPEQAQGASVDARSDIYSLGVVLYELVTGRPPFSGDNPVTIAYKHVREDPVPPRSRNPGVPVAFENIIMQAMAKDPDDRYQTAEELRADLLRFRQGGHVMAAPPLAAQPAPTQAVPVTTVQRGYVGDGTTMLPATAAGGKKSHTAVYVVLLLFLLGVLALVLYLIGRQTGVFGNDTSSTVTVPNVIGLDSAAAQAQLTQQGLTFKINQQPNSSVQQNQVFAQDPQPNTSAARNSAVTLSVSSGNATVAVPRVVGQNADDATAALQAAHFNVAQTLQSDDKRAAGIVIATNPLGGNTAPQGSTVTIVVSSGKQILTVPDETGRDAGSAEADLRSQGFTTARSTQPSDSVDPGLVISMDPPPGSQAQKGSKVTLVVSTGPTTTTSESTTTTSTSTTIRPTTTTSFRTSTTTSVSSSTSSSTSSTTTSSP